MSEIVANENTLFGLELKLVRLVWMKLGVTCTPKNFEVGIVRWNMKKDFIWRNLWVRNNGHPINQIDGRIKGLKPIG